MSHNKPGPGISDAYQAKAGVLVEMEKKTTILPEVVALTMKTNVKTVLSVTIKHVDTMGNQ